MADGVTHEQLGSQMTALNNRFERHEQHFQEVVTKLFDKAEQGTAAAHANSLQIAALQGSMDSIIGGRNMHLDRLDKVEQTVQQLALADSVREGERGVIAAMAKSPFITAIISAIVAVGAVILAGARNILTHAPAIIISVACMALLASSAIAAQT